MRLRALLISISVLVSGLVQITSLFGQGIAVSEDEFTRAFDAAEVIASSVPFRITSSTVGYYTEGKSRERFERKTVTERIPPDKLLVKLDWGDIHLEFLTIGDKRYSRNAGATWRETKRPKPSAKGLGSNESSDSHLFTRGAVFEGQTFNLFEVTKTRPLWDDGKETTATAMESYWFDLDGRLVRKVRNDNLLDLYSEITTTSWNYDPKDLKIEAPIK